MHTRATAKHRGENGTRVAIRIERTEGVFCIFSSDSRTENAGVVYPLLLLQNENECGQLHTLFTATRTRSGCARRFPAGHHVVVADLRGESTVRVLNQMGHAAQDECTTLRLARKLQRYLSGYTAGAR